LILIAIIWIASVLFFSAYRQLESSVALFVDRDIARTVSVGTWHFEVPAAWFQAVNPLLIFLFGPLLNLLWSRRQERMNVNVGLRRMLIGALLLAVSFGVFAATHYLGETTGAGTAAWVLIAIVPFTLAELYFDPIGQSLFSRLALRGYASLFMSVWFVSDLAAYGATAWLGEVWANSQPTRFFAVVSTLAIVAAALVLLGDCVAVYFRQSVRSHRSNAGA
jgi:POT family proton-dependent oligopeptide transporter